MFKLKFMIMWKSTLSWIIAIVISIIVIRMFWGLLFTMAEFGFFLFTNIMFLILVIIVAVPVYLVIKKKLFKNQSRRR